MGSGVLRTAAWAPLVLAVAGCAQEDQGLVVVTVSARPAITGVAVLMGEATSGNRSQRVEIILGSIAPIPPERKFGIDAPAGIEVVINLSALDSHGAVLGAGQVSAKVRAGGRTDVTLVLAPPTVARDGGAVDQRGDDLTMPDRSGLVLRGAFAGGVAEGSAGNLALRGRFVWHAAVNGSGGGYTLKGWLR
jgi:hypothetical protein